MITVWGRENSTNVKKVRWCLEELELPYHAIPAGGKFGLNNEPEYLAMNPNGLIPCLRDDETGITLWESNTIVRYLAAQYGQNRIWFDSPTVRAQGEKWMDWAASTLPPAHRVVLFGLVRTPPEQRNMAQINEGIAQCDKLLGMLDAELGRMPWLSGEQFGPGDIAVAPYVYNLWNIDIELTPRPHLQRWYQQLSERPAFRHTVMIPVS
ncbi:MULTISPECIES: glutathione S-transferase family protein [Atlantibacter]|uniref:glutathione S-transferase family protein n=1 Tax=Atlantibacter TaxID=1903434 RepID=UPI001606913C|nr:MULTISPECIES: glutathione S-transferase family protein [Atlantibacter]MBB3321256.1 glutathione S-transferase [Atlantibacter sp. RC6]MCZ7836729.1 glutathione S-transferase family protein [Atlantibacter hermannii]